MVRPSLKTKQPDYCLNPVQLLTVILITKWTDNLKLWNWSYLRFSSSVSYYFCIEMYPLTDRSLCFCFVQYGLVHLFVSCEGRAKKSPSVTKTSACCGEEARWSSVHSRELHALLPADALFHCQLLVVGCCLLPSAGSGNGTLFVLKNSSPL